MITFWLPNKKKNNSTSGEGRCDNDSYDYFVWIEYGIGGSVKQRYLHGCGKSRNTNLLSQVSIIATYRQIHNH